MKEKLNKQKLDQEKTQERKRKKREAEYSNKLGFYDIKVQEMNEAYKKTQKIIRHSLYRVRVKRRRDSDGMLGVKFPIEEQHFDVEKLIDEKKKLK